MERAPRLSTRPLRADAQRNRTRVLEAAKAAFADEGLAVPLDEIARRAGVGAGTVYRHFPTKEALFEAVILDRVRKLADHAETLTDGDPGEAFFGFLQRVLSGATAAKDLVDALVENTLDTDGLIAEAKQDLHRAGGKLLVRAQKAGVVRGDVGVIELMVLLTAASRTLREQGGDGDLVFSILREGLRAR
jgi:AcrR family transcriptional regulator